MTELNQDNWNRWYDCIYGYFYRRLNLLQDVEELTVATLEVYFLNKQEIANPKAFLFKIARNKLLEFIRQKAKHTISLDDVQVDQYSDNYLDKRTNLLDCAEKQLKNEDWQIVEMSVLCDFSSKRVAEQTALTPAAVRQKLSRALKKLREKCREI